jgi:DNA-binding NarL/FixJ family response regulator
MLGDVIRVAILDRHPALRCGLAAMLAPAPGFAFAGAVSSPRELPGLIYRTDPDIVVVDDPAVRVCGRARVILYTSRVIPETVLAARVAGFAGVVDKGEDTLLAAIRAVAAGDPVFPAVDVREHARAARRLDPRDRPVFAMRLAGTAPRDIASVVGLGVAALNARLAAIVGVLAPAGAAA